MCHHPRQQHVTACHCTRLLCDELHERVRDGWLQVVTPQLQHLGVQVSDGVSIACTSALLAIRNGQVGLLLLHAE